MGEVYSGPKFDTRFLSDSVPNHESCSDLIKWCHRVAELGMAPVGGEAGNAGNLSFRTRNGFIITGAGTDLAEITTNELVEVLNIDSRNNIVFAQGGIHPSSESLLHDHIYRSNHEIKAVIHGHYQKFFMVKDEFDFTETESEIEYGTRELGRSTAKILGNREFLLLKNHGFIAVGKEISLAGETLIKIYDAVH